jgi:hypothetical protein
VRVRCGSGPHADRKRTGRGKTPDLSSAGHSPALNIPSPRGARAPRARRVRFSGAGARCWLLRALLAPNVFCLRACHVRCFSAPAPGRTRTAGRCAPSLSRMFSCPVPPRVRQATPPRAPTINSGECAQSNRVVRNPSTSIRGSKIYSIGRFRSEAQSDAYSPGAANESPPVYCRVYGQRSHSRTAASVPFANHEVTKNDRFSVQCL